MAYYGLCYPVIAKLDVETGKYTDGFICGSAVSTDVTPNYNEASQHGDNQLKEYVKEFKDADVNAGVTEMPIKAANIIFGHKIDESTKQITYGAEDSPNYVGYGFYVTEMVNGEKKCVACWLPKVKFTDSAESFTTKDTSITFSNPSMSGKASPDAQKNWKYKQTFDTEEDAIEWLCGKAEIVKAAL